VYKAHQCANAIHQCFESRNVNLLLHAYMVYVRPLLEHNTVIWSSHLTCTIEATERVQRRFTKRLPRLNNFTYSEKLHRLGIPTLDVRMRSDLTWCYKITFGCINVTTTEFLMRRSTSTIWGHICNCTNNIQAALLVRPPAAEFGRCRRKIYGCWKSTEKIPLVTIQLLVRERSALATLKVDICVCLSGCL